MLAESIERDFQTKVGAEVRLMKEGKNRFRVFTPFIFDDGDHLSLVLKRNGKGWILSDEGHTLLHLSYDIDERDLQKGTRLQIIDRTLAYFEVENSFGELRLPIEDDEYGNALFSFVQALLRINDLSYLSREQVRSTFLEDFKTLISNSVPEDRLVFDWHDCERDPDGHYRADCRINEMKRPLFVYALSSDSRTRDATIALLKFEQWGVAFRSMAIFENQEEIGRRVLARFSDMCEKQFSSLSANRDRINRYVNQILVEAN